MQRPGGGNLPLVEAGSQSEGHYTDLVAGGGVHRGDSRNSLKEKPTGFTANWIRSISGRLAVCRTANSLAQHASLASVSPLTTHICPFPLDRLRSSLSVGFSPLLCTQFPESHISEASCRPPASPTKIEWIVIG